MSKPRIVVLGGFGNFGARICRRLAQEPDLDVIATARTVRGAAPGGVGSARLDTDGASFANDLAALQPRVVVHCAGPFQGQDYRVAEAALACGAHYIDLADGRAFVAQFTAALDQRAIAASRTAVSGASTLPALSSAVIDHLRAPFVSLDTIEMSIAPGQHAPRGIATMAAVLGYAGARIPWLVEGRWQIAHGWQNLVRIEFPFGRRWAAACDVPDLELFPAHYSGVQTVTFHAALEVAAQHFGLWTLAAIRRSGLPLPLARWASTLNRIGCWLDRFGSDRGGMRVSVVGRRPDGQRERRTWLLTARSNHGPEIPCMAAVLLTLKLARGASLATGARACISMLSLSEFETEFCRWDIDTQIDSTST